MQNVSSAAAGGDGVRVATVTVDRPCSKCGFNLVGQPIIRERHYGLFIARCPECGTVALIRGLGSGGGTPWAAVAAAVVLFVVLVAILGLHMWAMDSAARIAVPRMAGHVAGEIADNQAVAIGAGVDAAREAGVQAGRIRVTETDSGIMISRISGQRQELPGAAATGYPYLDERVELYAQAEWAGSYRESRIDRRWWADQDRAAILRDSGGVAGLVAILAVWDWLRPLLLSILVGLLLAVVLWHRSRLWLLVLLLLPAALSVAAMLLWPPPATTAEGPPRSGGAWMAMQEAGFEVVWPWVGLVIAGAAWAAAAAAVLAGRPLARLACSLFLPPRLNHTLAMLWADRGPPRGR